MGIRLFVYVLLIISVLSFFATVNNEVEEIKEKDLALVTFHNATMYTLTEDNVNRIVQSSKAMRFKTRDEMYKATFILRAKSEENKNLTDIISADFVEKKGSDLTFVDHVKYNRDDFISLKTDILHYNVDTKIAYNDKPFIGTYYSNFLIGEALYFDTVKTYFKSKKAHFEINIDEEIK